MNETLFEYVLHTSGEASYFSTFHHPVPPGGPRREHMGAEAPVLVQNERGNYTPVSKAAVEAAKSKAQSRGDSAGAAVTCRGVFSSAGGI